MTERASDRDDERLPDCEGVLGEQSATALRQAVAACKERDTDSAAVNELGHCARAAHDAKLKPEHFVRLLRTMWYEQRPSWLVSVDPDPRLIHLIDLALAAYFGNDNRVANGATNDGDAQESR
jgi:hypothetical protein